MTYSATSLNSKAPSADEDSPRNLLAASFLSNQSDDEFVDYYDVVGEVESGVIKSEKEKIEPDSKGNTFTKSEWEKVLDNDELEYISTSELLASLRSGIPFEL
mgnify:FL=1